jgi:metal-sulfur cluster biosynthetic enzyme
MLTEEKIIENVYKKYEDPELGIDIWTLGLIYKTTVSELQVNVLLTFTSPSCPFGPQMVSEIKNKIKDLGASKVDIEVTFDPVWKPSDELREILGV